MPFVIAIVLILSWALGYGVFHVAGGPIHLLLALAVIAIFWNFLRGRRVVG